MIGASGLDPSRERGQDLARRELSDPAYTEARPGWVERAVRWLLEQLADLDLPSGPGRSMGTLLLVLLLTLAVAVVLARTGRLRRGVRDGAAGAVLGSQRLTAAEHRTRAEQAAAAARYDVAVRERFRAMARALEERAVLDERPGRTAHEVAAEAAAAMPVGARGLRSAARIFDDVCYGGRAATSAHDAELRRVDDELSRELPVLAPVAERGTLEGSPRP